MLSPVLWLCRPHGNYRLIVFHRPLSVSYSPLCYTWLLGLQRVRAGPGGPGTGRAPASALLPNFGCDAEGGFAERLSEGLVGVSPSIHPCKDLIC